MHSELRDQILWQQAKASRKGLWVLREDIAGFGYVGGQRLSVALGPHRSLQRDAFHVTMDATQAQNPLFQRGQVLNRCRQRAPPEASSSSKLWHGYFQFLCCGDLAQRPQAFLTTAACEKAGLRRPLHAPFNCEKPMFLCISRSRNGICT